MKKLAALKPKAKENEKKKKWWVWLLLLLLLLFLLWFFFCRKKDSAGGGTILTGCNEKKALQAAKEYTEAGTTKFTWDQVVEIYSAYYEGAYLDPNSMNHHLLPERLAKKTDAEKAKLIQKDIWGFVFTLSSGHTADKRIDDRLHARITIDANTCERVNSSYSDNMSEYLVGTHKVPKADWPK